MTVAAMKTMKKALTLGLVVLSAAGYSQNMYEIVLDRESWLEACPALIGLQKALAKNGKAPQKATLISSSNEADGPTIEIGQVSFYVPKTDGLLTNIREKNGDTSVSFVDPKGLHITYQSKNREYLSDFWAEDGEAKPVNGYHVNDSAALTKWIFGEDLSIDELRRGGLVVDLDTVACSEPEIDRDIYNYLAFLTAQDSFEKDQLYILNGKGIEGTLRSVIADGDVRITFDLYDDQRSYMLSYRFPQSDRDLRREILKAIDTNL